MGVLVDFSLLGGSRSGDEIRTRMNKAILIEFNDLGRILADDLDLFRVRDNASYTAAQVLNDG